MPYIIYHDPDLNKVGCTNNPEKRMEEQQGLKPWSEYEIDRTDDRLKASHLEAWHKGRLGCKWDNDIYFTEKQNQMYKIKKTKTAKYFSDLNLSKEGFSELATEGVIFVDGNDEYTFSCEDAPELVKIAQTSFKATGIYFVPNAIKNLYENIGENEQVCEKKQKGDIKQFGQIRGWAEEKGIYSSGDPKTQMLKLIEEVGETSKAILNDDKPEIIDGLGDCLVVLINLSELCGYRLEECLESAYNEIKDRKGKMIDGTFVKQSL